MSLAYRVDLFEELVNNGAKKSAKDSNGRSAKDLASFYKQQGILEAIDRASDAKSHK